MPRYFFSLVDGKHSAADKYGKELDSLYEAHLHALRMFERLVEFIPDSLSPNCRIKITSATGEPVLTRIPQMRTRCGDLKAGISVILQGSSRHQWGWRWTVQRVKKAMPPSGSRSIPA